MPTKQADGGVTWKPGEDGGDSAQIVLTLGVLGRISRFLFPTVNDSWIPVCSKYPGGSWGDQGILIQFHRLEVPGIRCKCFFFNCV